MPPQYQPQPKRLTESVAQKPGFFKKPGFWPGFLNWGKTSKPIFKGVLGWRFATWVLALAGLTACASLTPPPPTPLPVSPTPATAEVILATGEWAPYTSETAPERGAFTDLVSAVFAEMGVTPRYVFYPWKRAEQEVREGKAFAAFPYIVTEERQQEFDFSEALMASTGKFFYFRKFHASPITYEQLGDLKPYRVGGVLGYWYETPFKEAELQTEYVSSDEQNLEKLHAGRVDLAATEELVGWAILKEKYPDELAQFATVEKPLNEDALHLLVSRQYPNARALLEKFDAALQTLKASGAYARLLAKYGLTSK